MKFKEYKLGYFIDSISDTTKIDKDKVVLINTSDVENGKVLNHEYVENKNLRGQFKKRFKKEDILYSEIRPQNKRFAYVDFDSSDYIASTKLMVLRNKGNIYNKFLFYLLKNDKMINYLQNEAVARSGTFPQITFETIKNAIVKVPELKTQKKIVEILEKIDNKLTINNEINNNLYELMNIHFNNWIESLDNYSEQSLSDIANYQNGLAMQKFRPVIETSFLPVIKIKEMNSGITSETEKCRNDIDEKVIVNDGDVLFAWSGTLCMKIWCGGKAGLNQHIFKVTSNKYPKWFYYFWTLKHLNEFINIAAGKATTMGHIKRTELDKAKVKVPNNNEIETENKILEPMLKQYILNEQENINLEQLRDTLLPKLMNGEIDLDKIEI